MNGSREKEMSHKNSRGECTGEMELVRLCFKCGDVADAPEVQAVLTAAKRVRQTPFYKRVALIDAVMNLNSAIRDLEEMESKDE